MKHTLFYEERRESCADVLRNVLTKNTYKNCSTQTRKYTQKNQINFSLYIGFMSDKQSFRNFYCAMLRVCAAFSRFYKLLFSIVFCFSRKKLALVIKPNLSSF